MRCCIKGLPLYDNKTEVDEGKVGELHEVAFFFSILSWNLHRALPEALSGILRHIKVFSQ